VFLQIGGGLANEVVVEGGVGGAGVVVLARTLGLEHQHDRVRVATVGRAVVGTLVVAVVGRANVRDPAVGQGQRHLHRAQVGGVAVGGAGAVGVVGVLDARNFDGARRDDHRLQPLLAPDRRG